MKKIPLTFRITIMLCIIISVFGLTACGKDITGADAVSSKYANLEVIEHSSGQRILVDRNTGVLYLWYRDTTIYGQTLTPLYNADGTLKNISDYEE